jgi:hypothetical protein
MLKSAISFVRMLKLANLLHLNKPAHFIYMRNKDLEIPGEEGLFILKFQTICVGFLNLEVFFLTL